MTKTQNTILDAGDLAEAIGGDLDEQSPNLETSHNPTKGGMNFFVKMDGYTLGDFEEMVIQTAAWLMFDSFRLGDMQKSIQDRAIELVTAKIDASLEGITSEIINAPLVGTGEKEPLTIKEFIAMSGRDYLTQTVDQDGKPTKRDHWNTAVPRIERIVNGVVSRDFAAEISSATTKVINEVRVAAKAKADEAAAAESKRLADAIRAISPEA